MTIIISAVTPNGIVMAGEGRRITTKAEDLKDGYGSGKKINYELVTDNSIKVHLVAGRFGLLYSGPSFTEHGWYLQNEINEFNRVAQLNIKNQVGFNVIAAAEIFNRQIYNALPEGTDYGLFWAGYHDYRPFQSCFRQGKNITRSGGVASGWQTGVPGWPEGCYGYGMAMLGKTEIIQDFLDGKVIRWDRMPLKDAIECVEWLMSIGIKGIRFFEGEQQVSGGDVDILVMTPEYSGFVKNKTLSLFGEGK